MFSLNGTPGKREQRAAGFYLGTEGGPESGTKSQQNESTGRAGQEPSSAADLDDSTLAWRPFPGHLLVVWIFSM